MMLASRSFSSPWSTSDPIQLTSIMSASKPSRLRLDSERKDETSGAMMSPKASSSGLDQLTNNSVEVSALLGIFEATSGRKWRNSKNWNNDKKALSKWQGVETNENGRVTKLRLLMNDLAGCIPECVSELPALDYLDMSNNKLIGSLPSSISKLTCLKELKLHYNQLSGNIPDEIRYLTSLKGLHLESNAFTGQIPLALCTLNNLTKLNLGLSQLSGSIPNAIIDLVNIQELKLNNNNLTGELPKGMSRLTNLKVLCLNDNKLEGMIPEELGSMSSLKKLHLHNNKLIGRLPLTFRTATQLTLRVENNLITGPLTTQELNKTSQGVKIASGVGCVLLAILIYWMIPLLLPFTGGLCLHNHIQFEYATSTSHDNTGNRLAAFGSSLYKGFSRKGDHSDSTTHEDVICKIPNYCKSVHLNLAFPFTLQRTITLSEVEISALFHSIVNCDSSGPSQVGFHVVTVTREIAQIIADALQASQSQCSISLNTIYIHGLETYLPLPAKSILLNAKHGVEQSRPFKIYYNRHNIMEEKVATLHITGMGYIKDYLLTARPFAFTRGFVQDWLNNFRVNSESSTPVMEDKSSVSSMVDSNPSLFQRAIDLVECSFQFDLANHPKCVSGRGEKPSGSSTHKTVERTAKLEAFIVNQCSLSGKVAQQLYNGLGVELVSDLTLLRSSDLDSIQLPLIPKRKLQLCICDAVLLPLQGKEVTIASRPLCESITKVEE